MYCVYAYICHDMLVNPSSPTSWITFKALGPKTPLSNAVGFAQHHRVLLQKTALSVQNSSRISCECN